MCHCIRLYAVLGTEPCFGGVRGLGALNWSWLLRQGKDVDEVVPALPVARSRNQYQPRATQIQNSIHHGVTTYVTMRSAQAVMLKTLAWWALQKKTGRKLSRLQTAT